MLKSARDPNSSEIRKASLLSLDILRKKSLAASNGGSDSQITYLRAKHLLPFFYRCLMDKDKQVRKASLVSIANFGPQGELMFIEGATKDRSPIVR